MSATKTDELEALLGRIEAGDPIKGSELRDIAADLEVGRKYRCATCQMYCTGQDVMVIFNTDTEEFIQIEVPMDEDEDVVVTRVS